jgi:hypothetical protein
MDGLHIRMSERIYDRCLTKHRCRGRRETRYLGTLQKRMRRTSRRLQAPRRSESVWSYRSGEQIDDFVWDQRIIDFVFIKPIMKGLDRKINSHGTRRRPLEYDLSKRSYGLDSFQNQLVNSLYHPNSMLLSAQTRSPLIHAGNKESIVR